MINQLGSLVEYNSKYQLIHEILHVTMAVGDSASPDPFLQNGPNYQFIATNLVEELKIEIEMGDQSQAVTNYLTRFSPSDAETFLGWEQADLGSNFTSGASIKYSRLGTEDGELLTMEPRDSSDPSNDLIFGLEGDDEIHGASGDDHLYGDFSKSFLEPGNDRLYGGAGDDHLYGGGGNDTFFGDPGNDEIWGGYLNGADGTADGADVADYSAAGAGLVIIFDGTGATSPLTVQDGSGGIDTLHSIERIVGSAHIDYLRYAGIIPTDYTLTIDAGLDSGDSVANAAFADSNIHLDIDGEGNGSLHGPGGGSITLQHFKTQIVGSTYGDEITDLSEHEGDKKIDGGSGDDVITVDGSDAMIRGGQGADIIHGGSGNDIIVGDVFNLNEANQLFGGGGSDLIIGKSTNDLLDGGDGHDYLKAVTGTVVRGGGGNDVIDFGNTSGKVNFGANDGHDLVIASDPSNNNDDVQLYLEGLSRNDVTIVVQDDPGPRCSVAIVVNATGASLLLHGVPGDANGAVLQLTFQTGGKLGQDFQWTDLNVVEGSVAQYDVALADYQAAIAAAPGSNTGTSGDDDMRGSRSDDSITGGGGNDSFHASGGSDTIDGGSGDDTLYLFGARFDFHMSLDAATGDLVLEDTTGLEGKVTIKSVEHIYFATDNETHAPFDLITVTGTPDDDALVQGNADDNLIYGLAGADLLRGLGGNDYLDGGTGADALEGGAGNDVYFVDEASDHVGESVGGGTDVVYSLTSYDLATGQEIEVLSTTSNAGTAAIDLIGNGFGQTIYGNAGVNLLDGGGGTDVLVGLGGNDIYFVRGTGDYVGESAGGGTDIVYTTVSYALGAGQEIEILSTTSNAGTAAIDLNGNDLANIIYGNAGVNVLDGGTGADVMIGLGGNDTFEFATALGNGNVDQIDDFVSGSDRIALDDSVFAQIGSLGVLDPNAFFAGSAAHDADDRIIYDSASGQLFYDADGNGTGAAVLFATLQGNPGLAAADFQVI